MIIMKFGGTSVADGERITRAASIVAARVYRQPIVVVSALAGVTDQLLLAARAARRGHVSEALLVADQVHQRHQRAIAVAIGSSTARERAGAAVERYVTDLRLTVHNVAGSPNGASRARDAVACHGELLSSVVFAAALESHGVPSCWVDARDVVITDAIFGQANPDRGELAGRGRRLLAAPAAAAQVPVTQGFIGATPEGTPTTMGRGASDYTAAILGAALNVEEVEIWTDVDGLMTADPRVAPGARSLERASYEEAAELAYFGARVLHAPTILPLFERGIPISIRNTARPDGAGTVIGPTADAKGTEAGAVKSIASKAGVTTINLETTRELGVPAFLLEMFTVIARHRVSVDVVATSAASISLTIEGGHAAPELVADLSSLGSVTASHNRALISVVGDGLPDNPGVAARAFRALEPVGGEMISQGASKLNLTFVVEDTHAPEAVRRLHDEFFSG